MFAVSCSSESIGHCLGMSMNSRSGWLKSGAEHYRVDTAINEWRKHLPVFAQIAEITDTSNIFCKQLDNWTVA